MMNKSGMMPLLDTMIWVGHPTRAWGVPSANLPEGTNLPMRTGALTKIILYKFFRKPVASYTPMHSKSAVPAKDQVQTVTNEFLRRMRNTSRDLGENHLQEVLGTYVCDLKRGGHHPNGIKVCLDAAATRYGRNIKEEINGGTPINRPAHVGSKTRRLKALTGGST